VIILGFNCFEGGPSDISGFGCVGVGKSSLLMQYTDATFPENPQATVGVEFGIRSIQIQGQTIKLQIWDTAGQESFRALTSSYYRGAHGALVVYDITRRETFEHMSTWLEDVRLNSDVDTVITLVGNKGDLESKRQVSKEDGRLFAEQNDLLFHEVSAKTAAKVDETFMKSAKMAYERYKSGEFQIEEPLSVADMNVLNKKSTKPRQAPDNQQGCC